MVAVYALMHLSGYGGNSCVVVGAKPLMHHFYSIVECMLVEGMISGAGSNRRHLLIQIKILGRITPYDETMRYYKCGIVYSWSFAGF